MMMLLSINMANPCQATHGLAGFRVPMPMDRECRQRHDSTLAAKAHRAFFAPDLPQGPLRLLRCLRRRGSPFDTIIAKNARVGCAHGNSRCATCAKLYHGLGNERKRGTTRGPSLAKRL